VAIAALYLGVRHLAGAPGARLGTGYYDLALGTNIPMNVLTFALGAVVPASSVTTFVAAHERDLPLLAAILAGTILFLAAVGYGLWRSGRPRWVMALGAMAVGAMFPTALMRHASELYVYNFMPFVSALVGMGLGEFLRALEGHRAMRAAGIAFVSAVFLSHVAALGRKSAHMRRNGERAARYLEQIRPHAARMPERGTLFLHHPDRGEIVYSIYRLRGFNVLQYGVQIVGTVSRRPDLAVRIIDDGELEAALGAPGARVLTLEGEEVILYSPRSARRTRRTPNPGG
jgi:hypothetical protein